MKNATPFRRSAKRTDQHQQRPQRYRPLSLAVALAFTGAGMALLAGHARAQALPTGGQVSAGAATVSRPTATSMLVNQTTDRVAINWQSFNIGAGNSVHFQQPSYNSIALNRVLGNSRSEIFGNLTSTGQVFLVNPNGVLFGAGAQVDVGGLVASTLNLTDRNFLDGKYVFGDTANATGGNGSVINQGTLNAKNGGYLALIGNQVVNTGTLHAHLGSVVMGAGGKAQLTLAGSKLIKFEVTEGALDALAENGGLIRANGGQVILTAGARDSLLKSTVNNTGIIEAQTVERVAGHILLLAGMEAGTTHVGGKLDASAPASLNPNGGDGGFIETSAATVRIKDDARITTKADPNGPGGKTGKWLIDPKDYTVAASGGDMTGTALSTALTSTNVELQSSSGGAVGGTAGNGDVNINDAVNWSANTLTLTAARDININAVMTASGTSALTMNTGTANGADAAVAGGLVRTGFNPGGGFKGRVDFGARSGTGFLTINGNGYTVINSLGAEGSTTAADLQGMRGNLTGYYALGTDIDATPTATWNYFSGLGNTPAHYRGFTPVGSTDFNNYQTMFRGSFNGLGHVITNLTVDRRYVGGAAGLFGAVLGGTPANPIFSGFARAGTLANVGLVGGAIRSHSSVGGLVGQATGATINNSFASNNVLGAVYTNAYGVVDAVVANNDYGGGDYVGGLVGHIEHQNYGSLSDRSTLISQSYATGNVAGGDSVGGLVGMNHGGTVINSHASGNVTGRDYAGGLVGLSRPSDYWVLSRSNAAVINSYATGNVQGRDFTGGLAGLNGGSGNTASVGGQVINSYATGNVTGNNFVGGLVGMNGNGGAALISGSYASGDVTGNLYVGGLAGFNSSITSAPLYILYLGVINNSHASGNVRGYNFVGGLVGALDDAFGTWGDASWSGIISSSYATGRVTGTSGSPPTFDGDKLIVYGAGASPTPFVGGLVGGTSLASYSTGLDSRTNADICANCFFNSQTSGQHPGIRGIVGGLNVGYDVEWDMLGTGRTTAQLQGSLPGGYTSLVTALPMPGFDPAIWGTGPGLYPYLKALNPNGVQAISGFATNSSGGALDGGRVAGLVNGQGVGKASVGANGYYYLATPGGTLGAGANVLTFTDGSGSAAAGAAISKVNGTVSAVAGLDISPGVVSESTSASLYSTYAATAANLSAAIGGNSSVAALLAPVGRSIVSSAAQFDIDQPLNLTGSLQIKTNASDADINVNNAVNWNSGTVSLLASRDVNINAVMSAGGSAALEMSTATGLVRTGFNPGGGFKGRVDFGARSGAGFLTINGNGYTVINSLGSAGSSTGTDLQGMNGNTAGYFALGTDIDATSTATWNYNPGDQITPAHYRGFKPVGEFNPTFNPFTNTYSGSPAFSGRFNGLGHVITNLTVNNLRGSESGLFGAVKGGALANVGLTGASVNGYGSVGGLVGGVFSGTINNSFVSGSVSGQGNLVGGLVGRITFGSYGHAGFLSQGYHDTLISQSYAAANVQANLNSSTGNDSGWVGTGGLVGYSEGGKVINSYATGNVAGINYLGGLVGSNIEGTVINSHASGNVQGNNLVGGLVGLNAAIEGGGTVINSYATGNVQGNNLVGGLVGMTGYGYTSAALVSGSYASGDVTGNLYVGGLAGVNAGYGTESIISNSHASGNVRGYNFVGGLAGALGDAFGTLNNVVDSPGWSGAWGGTISSSYATGRVTGTSGFAPTFGTDFNGNTKLIVSGPGASPTPFVGGLVGGGSTDSYTYGFDPVTALEPCGNCVFNSQTSGQNPGIRGALGPDYFPGYYITWDLFGSGRTSAQLQGSLPAGFDPAIWGTGPGLYPFLKALNPNGVQAISGFATNSSGGALDGGRVAGLVNGQGVGNASVGANGYYYLATRGGTFGTGANVLTFTDGSGSAAAGAAISKVTGTVSAVGGMDVSPGLLGETTTAALYSSTANSNPANLTAAIGGNSSVAALVAPMGRGISSSAAQFDIDVPLNLTGNLQIKTNASDADINVNNAVNWNSGTVSLLAARDVNLNAVMSADGSAALVLNTAGNSGSGNVKAGFNADGTFKGRVDFGARSGAGFLTINGNGYTVINSLGAEGSTSGTDLQGMSGNLTGRYALGANIDAGASAAWNGGLGFDPVGNFSNAFGGRFNGLGQAISNLTIARPGASDPVGLFGYVNGAQISNVGLAGGSVSGNNYVGGLAGANFSSTISNSYATGSVSGNNYAGGLAGYNYSNTISNSYATGSVSGNNNVGGLAGVNDASTISNSYTTGSVSGGNTVGGLAGFNYSSTISNSYATGSVTGNFSVGGLAGVNDSSTISNSYATGSVTGNFSVGGLVGSNNNGGTATGSFWDVQSSGQTGSALGTGLTSAQMRQQASFTGWDIAGSGGSNAVWRIYEGQSTPLLRSFLAPLTVTADNVAKTYDATSAGLTNAVYSNPAASGSANLFGVSTPYGAVAKNNVGSYAANLWSNQQGYDITLTGGSLTVTPAALLISGLSASNKVYDATTAATLNGTASIAALGSDNVILGGTAAGAFGDKNVGTGKAVTVTGNTISGADAANYNLVQQGGLTATITQASLTVSGITASNKVYDQTTAATVSVAAASLTGLIGGDAVAVNATGAFADKNVANGKTVTLTSGYTGADAGNYAITNQASTAADITPKALTVSGITASNKVYDQTTSATVSVAGASLTGLFGGDLVSVNATGAFADKNAALGKTVTLTSGYTGADVGNYAITNQASTTADITPRALTINAAGVNRVYDATTTATVNLSDNRISGDVLATGYGAASFADKNVANGKVVSVTGITLGSTDAGNYSFNTTAATTADITPKALSVAGITAANKVYDQTTAATVSVAGASYTGLIGGDAVTVSATGAFSDKNAALGKTVTLTSGYIGADVGNYAITNQASTTADISPKALTVGGITASNKVYDQTTAATVSVAGASLTGLIGGDVVAVNATGVFSDKNAATGKTVTLTSGYTGTDVGNYAITNQATTTADITPKALTAGGITASNKVYDQTTAATVNAAGASYTGLIGGDAVTVSASGAFSDKNAATGKIVTLTSGYTGADVVNYSITNQASATADITPKALTVGGITAGNKVYDQTTTATVNVGSASYTGLIGGDVVAVNATGVFSDKNAANGKTVTLTSGYTGADVGNYSITNQTSATADITPKALTVGGITAANKVYDQTAAAAVNVAGASYAGLIGGDAVSVNATGTFADKNVANGKTVTLTSGYSGADVGNYAITNQASTIANITPAALMVSGIIAANKVYDQTTAATVNVAGANYAGLFGGDSVTVNAAGTFSDKNAATAKTVTLTSGYTGADIGNYSITSQTTTTADITPKAATVTASNATKTYGGTLNFAGSAFTSSGLITGETIGSVNLASTGAASAAIVAGSPYAITASGAAGGSFIASNYNLSYVNGSLTINPAPLTITANGFTKTADSTPYSGGNGVIYTGLVNGESINVLGGALAWGGSAQGAVNAGNYVIAAGGLMSSNYSISYVDGALVINSPPVVAGLGSLPGAQAAINTARQGGGGGQSGNSGGNGGGNPGGNGNGGGLFTLIGPGMNLPEGVE